MLNFKCTKKENKLCCAQPSFSSVRKTWIHVLHYVVRTHPAVCCGYPILPFLILVRHIASAIMSTSTSTSRGRRKKDRRKSSAPEPIRLVRVTDRSTGVLLFEGIYKWADHTNTANLGSLIQSFFQFAREVDGGEVESVFFEESPFLVVPTPRSGSSDPKTTVSAADAMKMIHNKTDDIIIVVFYECSDGSEEGHQENLSQFVGCLRDEFTKMFDDRLNRVRPKILSLSESSPVSL